MTWANTPNKKKSDNPDEVIFVHPDDARLEEQQKSDELKKVEDESILNAIEEEHKQKYPNETLDDQKKLVRKWKDGCWWRK